MDYFGHNVNETSTSTTTAYSYRNLNEVFTCPNSGLQNVLELGAYVKVNTGTTYMRLAIYTAAGALVMQGSAGILINSTTLSWQSHTAFVDVNGNPIATPQLSGGANYILSISGSAGAGRIAYGASGVGYCGYKLADYVAGGFPASIGSGWTSFNVSPCLRCGVVPVPTISIPVFMNHYRQMRSQ